MKTPVILVAAALTAAILLAATLVIATGTRGNAVVGELRPLHGIMSSPGLTGRSSIPEAGDGVAKPRRTGYPLSRV
jgi:hypothetical protein